MVTNDVTAQPGRPRTPGIRTPSGDEVLSGDSLADAPRLRLTRPERRDQLLDVAGDLIQESGLSAVTMERVAQRAGVNKRITYRHFANADDLIVELFRREVADKRSRVRDALESNPDRSSEAGFRAFFSGWTDDNYVLLDLLTQTTAVSGPLREAQESFIIQSEEYFSTLYQRRLGLPKTSAQIAATLVLAALKGSIRSWDRGYGNEDEIERVFVAMIDGGLRSLVKSTGLTA